MFLTKLKFELILMILHVSNCQRRIENGTDAKVTKGYVVYLLKASISPQAYDGWICGGALVSAEYIITSAACVTDVMHLYVIAGYNKYVPSEKINTDECTKQKKKKVVEICTPKGYELKYEDLVAWSFIDIAVVKVESPYDLKDESYKTTCTHIPSTININLEQKFQETGLDSIVFGWGNKKQWRKEDDVADPNTETLQYAPTLIQDKEQCKKEYAEYKGMDETIDKYMICTFGSGNINDQGEVIQKSPANAQGCSPTVQQRLRGEEPPATPIIPGKMIPRTYHFAIGQNSGNSTMKNTTEDYPCEAENGDDEIVLIDNERRAGHETSYLSNEYSYVPYKTNKSNEVKNNEDFHKYNTRRNGICQNDHGGPLVTWVGSHEFLIGVASVFKVDDQRNCIGPFLYTSTQCNGAFLACMLYEGGASKRRFCESPPSVKGFEIVKNFVSWKSHPDGPADNEKEDKTNATKISHNTQMGTNFTEFVLGNFKMTAESISYIPTKDSNISKNASTYKKEPTSTTENLINVTNVKVTNATTGNVKTTMATKSRYPTNHPNTNVTINITSSTTENQSENTTLKVMNDTYSLTTTMKIFSETKSISKNFTSTTDTHVTNATTGNVETTMTTKSRYPTNHPNTNVTINIISSTTENQSKNTTLKVVNDAYSLTTTMKIFSETKSISKNFTSTTDTHVTNATTGNVETTMTTKSRYPTNHPNTNVTINIISSTTENQSENTTLKVVNDAYSLTTTMKIFSETKSISKNFTSTADNRKEPTSTSENLIHVAKLKKINETYPTQAENIENTNKIKSSNPTNQTNTNATFKKASSTTENHLENTNLKVINDKYSRTTTMKIFSETKPISKKFTSKNDAREEPTLTTKKFTNVTNLKVINDTYVTNATTGNVETTVTTKSNYPRNHQNTNVTINITSSTTENQSENSILKVVNDTFSLTTLNEDYHEDI